MDTPKSIRELIIKHFQEGSLNTTEIAKVVKRPRTTVSDVIRHFKDHNTVQTKRSGQCGRKRKLKVRDERAICRSSKVNPKLTARQIQQDVGGEASIVSIDTIKRTLRRHGRFTFRPLSSPSLNLKQKATRLRWCMEHRFWTKDQWRNVRIYFFLLIYTCFYFR